MLGVMISVGPGNEVGVPPPQRDTRNGVVATSSYHTTFSIDNTSKVCNNQRVVEEGNGDAMTTTNALLDLTMEQFNRLTPQERAALRDDAECRLILDDNAETRANLEHLKKLECAA